MNSERDGIVADSMSGAAVVRRLAAIAETIEAALADENRNRTLLAETASAEVRRLMTDVAMGLENRSEVRCPYCLNMFYGLPYTDPLRHHIDYCPDAPEDDE